MLLFYIHLWVIIEIHTSYYWHFVKQSCGRRPEWSYYFEASSFLKCTI